MDKQAPTPSPLPYSCSHQLYIGWPVYAAAGLLQGTSLVTRPFWKSRQRRLGIDDFGIPLPDGPTNAHFQHHVSTPNGSGHVFVAEVVGAGTEMVGEDEQAAIVEAIQNAPETTPLLPR